MKPDHAPAVVVEPKAVIVVAAKDDEEERAILRQARIAIRQRDAVRALALLAQVRNARFAASCDRLREDARGATYWWEVSTDQKSWSTFPPTRVAHNSFANLTPGTIYSFRYQVLTKAGLSDWSQIVTFMVK